MKLLMPAPRESRAGLSLVEIVIVVSVLVLLLGSISQSMNSMRTLTMTGSVEARLETEAQRALKRIVDDLWVAGEVDADILLGEPAYPHIFANGAPDPGYPGDHAYAAAPKAATALDSDFGADTGILILQPRDADANGLPDVDLSTHTVIWGYGQEISYTRAIDASGRAVLQRKLTGQAPRTIARDLERVVFEMRDGGANPDIPLGAVRVRLFFRAQGEGGTTVRSQVAATVRMRNKGA